MNSLSQLLADQLNKIKLTYIFLVVALFGFLDATYLTFEHLLGFSVGCSIVDGCDKVLSSTYSTILGFPTASLGMAYYLIMLFLSFLYINTQKVKVATLFSRLSVLGFIFSIWLVYLQIAVIKAICIYCMFSALSSTALFILGIFILKAKDGKNVRKNNDLL